MNNWKTHLKADPLPWQLEAHPENPGVCYFALTDLLDRPADDLEVIAPARRDDHRAGTGYSRRAGGRRFLG